MLRYFRNKETISEQEQQKLGQAKVCIIGLGGLGGYNLEMLARIGIGNLTVVDGDKFDETNLNRQLLATQCNLGLSKAKEAEKRVKQINDTIKVRAIASFFDESNADEILEGQDIVIDSLDTPQSRLLLKKYAQKYNIPMVYGAVESWYGQVSFVMPYDDTLSKIYKADYQGKKEAPSTVSFVPAAVACIQISQCIKYLLNKEGLLQNKLMVIDLLSNTYETLEF
jgi:molybdopterin/thiamine biosynthesis adenylyltransferase